MRKPASNDAGRGGAAGEQILPQSPCPEAPEGVAVFVRTLRNAARDPDIARRVNVALQRATLYDERPRDSLREYADARQPDRRLEPYLSALTSYAHKLDNPQS